MAAEAMERRFCFLKDQEPLTAEAHERAVALCASIRALIDGREAYIASAGLAPDIHLPMANWDLKRAVHHTSRTVLAGDYTVLNNLRLFTQIYSGHQLLSLSARVGLQIPRQMPADVDKKLADLVAAGH